MAVGAPRWPGADEHGSRLETRSDEPRTQRGGLFALLAGAATTRPWRVLTIAGLLLVLAAPWAAGIFGHLAVGGFYAPEDPAARAEALLDSEFPGAPPNVAVLLTAAGGIDGPTPARLGQDLTTQLSGEAGVTAVVSYWGQAGRSELFRSRDGRSALILFRLTGTEDEVQKRLDQLYEKYAHRGPGVQVTFGGAPATMRDVTERGREDLERAELVTAPLVFAVLLYAFGGVTAALLPVLVGGSAVIASIALLRVLAEMTPISVFSLNLTTALGFALAVDYSLFILRRFWEEQRNGRSRADSLRVSLQTAGRTVLFSGVTVALSLTGALLFPLPYLRSYAFAGVAVVITSEVAALLLLPAAIMVLGDRIDARRQRWAGVEHPAHRSGSTAGTLGRRDRRGRAGRRARREPGAVWAGIARMVMARPLLFGGAAVAVMLILAAPLRDLTVALADDTVLPATSESHIVNDAMRDDFAICLPCQIPLVVPGVDARDPIAAAQLSGYAVAVSAVPGVARVDTAAGSFAGGHQVMPAPADGGSFIGVHGGAWLSLWPDHPDAVSAETREMIGRIRAVPSPFPVYAGGIAPHLLETRDKVVRSLPRAVGMVVLVTFVLLFLFTGSVVLPIKALVLNALNLAAVLGVLVLVFQEGHVGVLTEGLQISGTTELTSPVLMFCIAFGLSMDYEIFLLSRIREEYLRTGNNARSVARGLGSTGPLITCAALALIVVMIGVATSEISIIRMVGVGLAVAVILDVTVVRAILVPAFMALAGDYNWWAPRPMRLLHERYGLHEGHPEETGERAESEFLPRPARWNYPVRAGSGFRAFHGWDRYPSVEISEVYREPSSSRPEESSAKVSELFSEEESWALSGR
ncbi:hypothetical protein CcI49_21410 [Frankia sp. CcI49]|uniref:MMPL family transporter n=1 Tax=Frankia sp. CcI49 TaxID=1745382 RepID=UPI000976A100|nr:MMPL family transporter [Frankia sp. CcI49]ONH58516.1 hypothetical protein CcI49_21410 [Frankia sp. CcI49]